MEIINNSGIKNLDKRGTPSLTLYTHQNIWDDLTMI